MKVSCHWLKQFVDFSYTPDELSEHLTMLGLEVASVDAIGRNLSGIVVGYVKDVKPHPDADKLKICSVDIGTSIITIVCGASNVKSGQYVPVATDGAILPDGRKIVKTTLKGVASEGMICSAHELALSDNSTGIMVLDGDLTPGTLLMEVPGIIDDVLEIELTPNRPDCLSIFGVAREIALLNNNQLSALQITVPKVKVNKNDIIPITIDSDDLCEKYAAYVIRGITVGPSPFWLRFALEKLGLRSINNIVDITNYVLLEMGHPLHAFDLNTLQGSEIIVRRAREGESIVTIDDKDRVLDSDMLVIADHDRPVAIAGVMGGDETAVSETTTDILLEGAYFNPVSIRKTSKRLGLSTDSSYRFERGVDRRGFTDALRRAACLIAELGRAESMSELFYKEAAPYKPQTVSCSFERIRDYIGIDISDKAMQAILTKLGIGIQKTSSNTVSLDIPSYRVDLSIEEDIVEEVARVYGYNNIPAAAPGSEFVEYEINPSLKWTRMTRNVLSGMGFYDTLTCSLVHLDATKSYPSFFVKQKHSALCVKNPISEMQHALQTSLAPNMLNMLEVNRRHADDVIRLFEIGRIFIPIGDNRADEAKILAVALSGQSDADSLTREVREWDFYSFKGILEGYLGYWGIDHVRYEKGTVPYLHPGRTAHILIGNDVIGYFGQLHPSVAQERGIHENTYLCELLADSLIESMNLARRYQAVAKFPAVDRDLAIVLDKATAFQAIYDTLRSALPELLENLQIISIYEGTPIPEGKKSINFRMTYRSGEKTLQDEEVDAIHNRLASVLVDELKCELR